MDSPNQHIAALPKYLVKQTIATFQIKIKAYNQNINSRTTGTAVNGSHLNTYLGISFKISLLDGNLFIMLSYKVLFMFRGKLPQRIEIEGLYGKMNNSPPWLSHFQC